MAEVIALAGKGGTGKTTVAGLVVRSLRRANRTPILAVDADPNSCLDAALGLHPARTISDVLHASHGLRGVPETMPKATYLEYELEACLAEGREIDLIEMGRPEGPACYCSANHLLRSYIDRLMGAYRTVVVDNEAGMEHLSRRTTRGVDLMFIVSDPSRRGLDTAVRIRDLARELKLDVRRVYLVISRVRGALEGPLADAVESLDIELAGVVPDDQEITRLEESGEPLTGLGADSEARRSVREMMESVLPGVKG